MNIYLGDNFRKEEKWNLRFYIHNVVERISS